MFQNQQFCLNLWFFLVDLETLDCGYEDPDVGVDPLKPPDDDCYGFYSEENNGPKEIPTHVDVQVIHLLCVVQECRIVYPK